MTILIGALQAVGGVAKLLPPAGFNSIAAVRLSSFNPVPVIVNNVGGWGQSGQQYLMPNQSNVYATQNVSTTPTLGPVPSDTIADVLTNVYVEWSTDPQVDFVGVYPAQLSLPADVVAEAIFEQGVPNVLITDTVVSQLAIPSPSQSQYIDVSKYASVTILCDNNLQEPGWNLEYFWFIHNNAGYNQVGSGYWGDPTPVPVTQSVPLTPITIPVQGQYLAIVNSGTQLGASPTFTVIGTNREIWPRPHLQDLNTIQNGASVTKAFAVNSETFVGTFLANPGQTQIEMVITGSTVKGLIALVDSFGNTLSLTDSSEMHANPSGNASVYKQIVAPPVPTNIEFFCSAAGTATVLVRWGGYS